MRRPAGESGTSPRGKRHCPAAWQSSARRSARSSDQSDQPERRARPRARSGLQKDLVVERLNHRAAARRGPAGNRAGRGRCAAGGGASGRGSATSGCSSECKSRAQAERPELHVWPVVKRRARCAMRADRWRKGRAALGAGAAARGGPFGEGRLRRAAEVDRERKPCRSRSQSPRSAWYTSVTDSLRDPCSGPMHSELV
jgi:hypothetical protein